MAAFAAESVNFMDCKFCGMPLEDENAAFCPHCGKPLTEDTAAEETAAEATEEAAEAAAEETAPAAPVSDETAPGAPKKPNGKLIGIVAAAIAVIAVALILLIPRLKHNAQGETPVPSDEPAATETQPSDEPAEDTSDDTSDAATPTVSYSATAEELTDEVLARVVAVCGSEELTNRDLAYYYWNQYYSFQNAYGMYMAYLMDQTKALEDQMSPDGENTWQQMLLNSGVEMFQSIAALNQKAQAADFQLSEESEQQLTDLKDTCEQSAAYFGYDSGDAYIQSVFGPSASVDGYVEFCRKLLLTTEYLQSLVDAEAISDADVAAYYDEHAEEYAAQRRQIQEWEEQDAQREALEKERGVYDTWLLEQKAEWEPELFGLPGEGDMTQEEAVQAAREAVKTRYGLTDAELDEMIVCRYFYRDGRWRIDFRTKEQLETGRDGYEVWMDAKDGSEPIDMLAPGEGNG